MRVPLFSMTLAPFIWTVTAVEEPPDLEELADEIDKLQNLVELVLSPIAILVAILSLGGVLSVVFSIRDQRRASQLHELAVGSEVATQRRAEQTYASFLEQSQLTLSLVNDTLNLAKDANENATRSTALRVKARIAEIEDRAQRLMLDVFGRGVFEAVLDDAHLRDELRDTAERLRALEGWRSMQEIELPPYTRFVEALDLFLRDDTLGALNALRHAEQERLPADLRRATLYWIGYMLTTVGDYEEAMRRFRDDEAGLARSDRQRLQLDRMIHETDFFLRAKRWERAERKDGQEDASPRGPRERFEAVASVLDDLGRLATLVDVSDDHGHVSRLSHEVARTRADIFAWVAYDATRLDEPLDPKARTVVEATPHHDHRFEHDRPFVESDAWLSLQKRLATPDQFRVWAWREAEAITEAEEDRDFYVAFALAEARFALSGRDGAVDQASDDADKDDEVDEVGLARSAFAEAEFLLTDEYDKHREQRRKAEIEESSLIIHARLYALAEERARREQEARHVRQASRRALEAVREMRQQRVTVFSQLERRNISQERFRAEIREIVRQSHIDDMATSESKSEA